MPSRIEWTDETWNPITGCVRDSASPWAEPDSWHWLLAEAKPLPFFACKGSLGFFKVDYPHPVQEAA